MHGSLALARGTLFVGLQAKTASVRCFDLGGRPLPGGFDFRDERAGRSVVSGLAVDEDHQVWVADTPGDVVRVFSLFGREGRVLGGAPGAALLPGLVGAPADVEVRGHADEGWVAVACAGERRHAVQIFDPALAFLRSCASLGDPQRLFRGVRRLAAWERLLYVAEAGERRVQVFRDGEFHFAFHLTTRTGERLEPVALAPTGDGRLVVATRAPESALVLVDSSGRALRVLAEGGEEEGSVHEPGDVVLDPGRDDRHASIYVIDREGLRIQVFTLEGAALGSLAIESAPLERRQNP